MNRLSTKPLRINVIGTSGSGKSTFARRLAAKLNYPYIEMDQVFWGPNWHWPSDDVFLGSLKDRLEGESANRFEKVFSARIQSSFGRSRLTAPFEESMSRLSLILNMPIFTSCAYAVLAKPLSF